MESIDTIVFDVGGVLWDNDPLECVIDYIANKKIDSKKEEIENYVKGINWYNYSTGQISGNEYWNNIVKDFNLDVSAQELADLSFGNMNVLKGIDDLVKELHSAGYKLHILSNNTEEWFHPFLNKYDFSKYFDKKLSSHEAKTRKPDEDFYRKLEIDFKKSIFLDDLERNTIVFEKLGGKAIVVQNAEQARDELRKHGVLAN